MAETFNTKLGRIIHDLQMVNLINNSRMQYPTPINTGNKELDEFNAGYNRHQDTMYRQLIKKIFGEVNKGNFINVHNCAFTLLLPNNYCGMTSVNFPAGIVDIIYMGAFPYSTSVTVYPPGGVPIPCNNVGAISITKPRTTKGTKHVR